MSTPSIGIFYCLSKNIAGLPFDTQCIVTVFKQAQPFRIEVQDIWSGRTYVAKFSNDTVNGFVEYALKSDLSALVKWVGISIPIGSLAAGAEKFAQSFEFVLDDGYASAALAGFTLGGDGYTNCSITKCFLIGNRVEWSIKNLGTSATGDDLKLNCQVMLIKQAFAG